MNRVLRPELGVIHPGKEDVPLLMPLRGHRSAAGETLVQQFKLGDFLYSKLAPVRKRTTAADASDLIGEKMRNAVLNAIILRLDNPNLIFIGKAQQAFFMNRRHESLMHCGLNASWRGKILYSGQIAHIPIVREFCFFLAVVLPPS